LEDVVRKLFRAFAGVQDMQITAPFKHALLVSDQVSDRAQTELLGSVIAHAGFGVVFVAADRRIIYANDTAETLMHARGGLRRERNCISTADFTSSRKLQSLITAALRQTHEPAQGGALIHCNEEGEPSLVVHVVPFGQHADLQPD
jgi:hypothetical protein